ncbi:MAG: YHS domain-containing (seleno)protein [Shimia sp.]
MLTRRSFIAATLATPFVATMARAAEPRIYQEGGVAIDGTDPTSYFTDGAPIAGDPAITATHDGATFRFASTAARDLFTADPARYAPQYGGYCAYAVSQGYTAPTVPEAWSIVDDKLYLNFSRSVRVLWNTQRAKNIRQGDANWPSVLG